MSSRKRHSSELQICDWIEEGQIEHVSKWRQQTHRSLNEIRTSCGSNLMVVAPHPVIAEWLEEEGVDIDDRQGDLLCNSYQSVAKWLTKKSISIVPALQKMEQLQHVPLSPTTRHGLLQRKQELLEWKKETNQTLLSIMVDKTPLIKDIAKLIVQYLR